MTTIQPGNRPLTYDEVQASWAGFQEMGATLDRLSQGGSNEKADFYNLTRDDCEQLAKAFFAAAVQHLADNALADVVTSSFKPDPNLTERAREHAKSTSELDDGIPF
ncbi:MAG: hypothetical protein AAF661_16375 [Pseudomonadota bacterium]